MRIATPCDTEDEFIDAFFRYCENSSFFVSTLSMRQVGQESAFSVDLRDGRPMLRGFGVVLDAWPDANNRFGRPGVHIGIYELTNDSKRMFEQLMIARGLEQDAQRESRALPGKPSGKKHAAMTRQIWAINPVAPATQEMSVVAKEVVDAAVAGPPRSITRDLGSAPTIEQSDDRTEPTVVPFDVQSFAPHGAQPGPAASAHTATVAGIATGRTATVEGVHAPRTPVPTGMPERRTPFVVPTIASRPTPPPMPSTGAIPSIVGRAPNAKPTAIAPSVASVVAPVPVAPQAPIAPSPARVATPVATPVVAPVTVAPQAPIAPSPARVATPVATPVVGTVAPQAPIAPAPVSQASPAPVIASLVVTPEQAPIASSLASSLAPVVTPPAVSIAPAPSDVSLAPAVAATSLSSESPPSIVVEPAFREPAVELQRSRVAARVVTPIAGVPISAQTIAAPAPASAAGEPDPIVAVDFESSSRIDEEPRPARAWWRSLRVALVFASGIAIGFGISFATRPSAPASAPPTAENTKGAPRAGSSPVAAAAPDDHATPTVVATATPTPDPTDHPAEKPAETGDLTDQPAEKPAAIPEPTETTAPIAKPAKPAVAKPPTTKRTVTKPKPTKRIKPGKGRVKPKCTGLECL